MFPFFARVKHRVKSNLFCGDRPYTGGRHFLLVLLSEKNNFNLENV